MSYQVIQKSLLHSVRSKFKPIRIHREITILKNEEIPPFMEYRTKIIQDAVSKETLGDFPLASRRLERFLKYYMIPGGKLLRPQLLIYIFKSIMHHYKKYDTLQMDEVYKMAWCLELFNNQVQIIDDIMDDQDMRRGKITWNKMEDIGLTAVTEPPLVLFSMFKLLQQYFSQHPNYCKIIESIVHNFQYSIAEATSHEIKRLDDYNLDGYNKITRMKNTYYCFIQPLEIANLLAKTEFHNSPILQRVLSHFAFLYGAQNDVADAYPEVLNEKPGTDIRGNVFTLPITIALRKASPVQRKVLEECYGQYDEEKVNKVRQIYDELDIIGEYYKIENDIFGDIARDIKKITDDFTRSLVEKIAYAYTFGEVGVSPN